MRYLKIFKKFPPLLVLAAFIPACYGAVGGPKPVENGTRMTCHDFDANQTLRFNFKGEGVKTYVLVKKGAQITAAKIREGEAYEGSYIAGVSRLRKVGQSEPPKVHDIFWLDKSYRNNNTEDFIFAFQEVLEDGNYLFDIYGDNDKFKSVNDLPDFVKDCKLEGGGNLVPIDNPGTEFPPVVIGIGEVDKAGYELNFDEYRDEYTEKYTHDRIAPPVSIPSTAKQIGVIILRKGNEAKPHAVFYHAGSLFLKDQGDASNVYQYSGVVGEVSLPQGAEPELQLSSIKFVTPFVWSWWVAECKPAIYFYPEEEMELRVSIDPQGVLTQSEPLYSDGWQITAYPGGRVLHQGKFFRHLDYEAQLIKVNVPSEGFGVEQSELKTFFGELLPKLGLTNEEIADFEEYWLSRLKRSPYYFVALLSEEEIERIEPLRLSSDPDSLIRVRFYFKGLENPIKASSPVLGEPIVREGFTVVEWGGVVDDGGSCR